MADIAPGEVDPEDAEIAALIAADEALDTPPAPPADFRQDEPSTDELLANAPPLILPGDIKMLVRCDQCGLNLEPGPDEKVHEVPCPNCGTPLVAPWSA